MGLKEAVIEAKRKSIHIIPGVCAPILIPTFKRWTTLIAVFFGILYTLLELKLKGIYKGPVPIAERTFKIMARDEEIKGRTFIGAVYFWWTTTILILFFNLKAAMLAIMISSLADAAAAVIGKLADGPRIPYCKRKTIIGSLAFLVTSTAITIPFVGWRVGLVVSLVAMLIESLPIHYTLDEITVPLGAGFLLQFLL